MAKTVGVLWLAVVARAIGVLRGKGCGDPSAFLFCLWQEVLAKGIPFVARSGTLPNDCRARVLGSSAHGTTTVPGIGGTDILVVAWCQRLRCGCMQIFCGTGVWGFGALWSDLGPEGGMHQHHEPWDDRVQWWFVPRGQGVVAACPGDGGLESWLCLQHAECRADLPLLW